MAPTAAKGMRTPIEPRRGGRNSARGEAKRNPWKRFPQRLNPEGVTGMWNVEWVEAVLGGEESSGFTFVVPRQSLLSAIPGGPSGCGLLR